MKKCMTKLLSCGIVLAMLLSMFTIGIVPASAVGEKDFDYEIIQTFNNSKTYTRNSMWSRGMLATTTNPRASDGATDIYQFDALDVQAGNDKLNGTPALALRVTSAGAGWGATHLINDGLPEATISNMSGLFFRMKTDTTTSTVLSVTTVGKGTVATGNLNTAPSPNGNLLTNDDKNDNNDCGNAGALLDNYSITKNSQNIRYYSTSGTLLGTGREVPAGFDGYVFIEVKNFDSYTKDGLTINWIDSDFKYAKDYTSIGDGNHKWCVNGALTKAIIDNVGYYSVKTANTDTDYQAMISDMENPAVAAYDYEIIQNFTDKNSYTRNSMWSRGMLATDTNPDTNNDGAASIYQFEYADVQAGNDRINGTPALALRVTSAGQGWGASHLINDNLPDATISNMSGIFFRFKTNTTTSTVLSLTTVGKNTVATGTLNTATSPNGKLLTDDDKNDNNNCGNAGALLDNYSITKNSQSIRYYSTSGKLLGTGREVPAGFDGYVFVEVKNFDSYTKDGLTINWIDSDFKYAKSYTSIGDTNHKWCVNGTYTKAIIDNVGYYYAGHFENDIDYNAIISDIENPTQAKFDYEIIQNFSDNNSFTRNSNWSRGILTANNGAANIYQLDAADVAAGKDRLNGTPAMALRMVTGNGWGSSHLINNSLPTPTIGKMSGVFFRFKTDTKTSTVLSLTTVGKNTVATGNLNTAATPNGYLLTNDDKNANNDCGNGGALLDNYSITKNSQSIRYYSLDGTLSGTGREVPAGFDGYVFIEVKNLDSYTKDGLTINWIDSDYDYVKKYTGIGDGNHKWFTSDFVSAVFDDVGYYYAAHQESDIDYKAIIDDFETPKFDYEIIQDFSDSKTYTRNSMWSRGALTTIKNTDVGATDGATNIYQISREDYIAGKDRLNTTPALALCMSSAGKGWGSTHLVNDSLPTPTIQKMSGVFFRFKVETKSSTVLSVTTVGKNTVATGSTNAGSNPLGNLLTDDDKNANNVCGNAGALLDSYSITKNSTNIRYYDTDGALVSTGRVVPKDFDGYVFIEVKDFDSYIKDGLTINWMDSDYDYVKNYAASIADSNHKWCLNDGTMNSVVIDDLGYFYSGHSDRDFEYASIITEIEQKYAAQFAKILAGDLNLDDRFDSADMAFLIKLILSNDIPPVVYDLNNDAKIDILDLVRIKKLFVAL